MYGESSQADKNGKAIHRADGLLNISSTNRKMERNGVIIISLQAMCTFNSLPKTLTVCAAVTHWSKRLRVIVMRTSVVAMASKEMNASLGRKTTWKSERSAACWTGRAVVSGY